MKNLVSFLMLFAWVSVLQVGYLYPQQKNTSDKYIKEKLNKYVRKIKTLRGDMEYIIEGERRIKQEGKFYFKSPDKLRMDFVKPVETSIIEDGKNTYIKSYNSRKYEKVKREAKSGISEGDIFGFRYLARYRYRGERERSGKELSKRGKKSGDGEEKGEGTEEYYGYERENNKEKIKVIIKYNIGAGEIESYRIIGNGLMPESRVNLKKYREIGGIKIPERIECKIRMQGAEVRSIIILREVKVNEGIEDGKFKVR